MDELLKELDRDAYKYAQSKGGSDVNSRHPVVLDLLRDELDRTKKPAPTASGAGAALARFPPKVKANIDRISDFMKREGMTVAALHKILDENGDGKLEKHEFVPTMMKRNAIPGITAADLGLVFDALDVNGDGEITFDEFALYLEGSKKQKEERKKDMDPEIKREMQDQVAELFTQFDADGDGEITAEEIHRTLLSFGMRRTLEQCRAMIRSVPG